MVHDFWMGRDDADFARSLLPGTRTVLDWFLARVGTDGRGSGAAAAQLNRALREAAALERTLGDAHRAQIYATAAART